MGSTIAYDSTFLRQWLARTVCKTKRLTLTMGSLVGVSFGVIMWLHSPQYATLPCEITVVSETKVQNRCVCVKHSETGIIDQ